MKDTIYVIGSRQIFDQRLQDYQNGIGFYYESGFNGFVSVRHSLDGKWTLLEEIEDKFDPNDLALDGVTVYTKEQVLEFLMENKENWEIPITY